MRQPILGRRTFNICSPMVSPGSGRCWRALRRSPVRQARPGATRRFCTGLSVSAACGGGSQWVCRSPRAPIRARPVLLVVQRRGALQGSTRHGSCYRSKSLRACERLGLRQIFTKSYTSKTNGKAERFIQTALRECARVHQSSNQRTAELFSWLHRYNLASTTCQLESKHTYQWPRPARGQPIEAPHIARDHQTVRPDRRGGRCRLSRSCN
jgi:transposase InsO family protein